MPIQKEQRLTLFSDSVQIGAGIAVLIRSAMGILTDMADDAANSLEGHQNTKEALRNKIRP